MELGRSADILVGWLGHWFQGPTRMSALHGLFHLECGFAEGCRRRIVAARNSDTPAKAGTEGSGTVVNWIVNVGPKPLSREAKPRAVLDVNSDSAMSIQPKFDAG